MNDTTTGTQQPPNGIVYQDQELTIEQVQALFFDSDAVMTGFMQPVYRFDHHSSKFYYTFNTQTFRPEYFMAVTSFIQQSLPTPPTLMKWYADMGWEKAEAQKRERGYYGTLLDMQLNRFIIDKKIDIDSIPQLVKEYAASVGATTPGWVWIEELRKDLLGFAQFVVDYNVKPIAVGMMLVSRSMGIGGQTDFVCEMNAQLYTDKTPESARKRIRVILDFKGGKKGFYESHIIQLEAYKRIWEENFPENPIDNIANWAGKDWRKSPTYELEFHGDKPQIQKLDLLVELAKIGQETYNKSVRKYHNELSFGKSPENNYTVIQSEQFIINQMLNRK